MIHPRTKLVYINDLVGYGLFATEFIPEGTITYVKDPLELEITPKKYRSFKKEIREMVEKYSYRDENGNLILSWDMGKYVNHCCTPTTISTGYGFEIAIRDIFEGEQITDEYGIFNLEFEMMCECGDPHCRKIVQPEDFDTYYKVWDEKIKKSLAKYKEVDQPLAVYLDDECIKDLKDYHGDKTLYKTVYNLRFHDPSLVAVKSSVR